MKNRDYWAKPIQSDRSHHEYGNTRLTPEERGFGPLGWLVLTALAVTFAAALFYS